MCEIETDKIYTKEYKQEHLPCMDAFHQLPLYMYVPPGQIFERVCPTCGQKITICGTSISY